MLTVGRAADNDVRVDGPDFSPHHLRVTVEGERFRVEAVDAGAHFTVEKRDTRSAVVAPSSVGVGRFVLRACAFPDHYNCPIPPRANVLPITIRAGEMDSHYH